MPGSPANEKEALRERRLRAGRIVEELLDRHRAELRGLAGYRLGSHNQDIDDVLQAAAVSFILSFNPDNVVNPLGYLKDAVSTNAIKTHRTRQRHPETSVEDLSVSRRRRLERQHSAPPPYDTVDELDAIRQELATLDDQEHQALALRALGFKAEEIAERTGLSVRQVRRSIQRGNRALGLDPRR